MSRSEFIKRELSKLPATAGVVIKGDYAWIKCAYHKGKGEDGLERTPSMRVVLTDGKFRAGFSHCFACGKSVGWKTLATTWRLGIGTESNEAYAYAVVNDDVLASLFGTNGTGYDMDGMLPWTFGDWRGISERMLQKVGARQMYSEVVEDLQLYLPCMVEGLHAGGISCVIAPTARTKRKYINTPGEWAKQCLYPYDFVHSMVSRRELDTVVLVEGPRDALRLIQYGVPALSMIGAGQWSKEKLNLLLGLDIQKLILAFDPDDAGTLATRTVYQATDKFFEVSAFRMNADIKEDPGNMSPSRIRELKACVY